MENDENIVLYDGIEEQPRAYDTEAEAASGDGGAIYTEAVDNRIKLADKLDSLSPDNRRCVIKVMQMNILIETMEAIKNMKSTPESVWRKCLNKMQAIQGINIGDDKSRFDFNKFLNKFIPMVALLAGLLLALRESDKEESETSEPEEGTAETTPESAKIENEINFQANKAKSIILQYCSENINGFSLTKK